mgnify:FL=1
MGYNSALLPSVVTQIFKDFPGIELAKALPIAMQLLNEDKEILLNNSDILAKKSKSKSSKSNKAKSIPIKNWHTLDTADLRFQYSQKADDKSFYTHLKHSTLLIFDFEAFLKAS